MEKGTLNFTSGNNIIIADGSAETYRGLGGDDIYYVSQILPKNSETTIIDTTGSNIIQMPKNTYIDDIIFTNDAVKLTLKDNQSVVINGADNFLYNLGGSVTDGTEGETVNFTEFASIFGVSDILNSSGFITGDDVISDIYII